MGEHTIASMELRRRFGDILDQVRINSDRFVVERNKKPIAVISSINEKEEYEQLVREKITAVESKIKQSTVLAPEEYDFLLKHKEYAEHQHYTESERHYYCDSEVVDTLSHFGGGFGIEPLNLDALEKRIAKNEAKQKQHD